MIFRASRRHSLAMSLAFGVATVLAGCGSKQESNTAAPATEPAATTASTGRTACRSSGAGHGG